MHAMNHHHGTNRPSAQFVFSLIQANHFTYNIKIFKFVGGGIGSNDMKVISQVLLFEVFLGQIFQVTLGKRKLGSHKDAWRIFTFSFDFDFATQIACSAVDFDFVLKKFHERSRVKNVVLERNFAVDAKFLGLDIGLFL